jgi:hypothetical protein
MLLPVLALAISVPAAKTGPGALRGLKPHQMVEQLRLSDRHWTLRQYRHDGSIPCTSRSVPSPTATRSHPRRGRHTERPDAANDLRTAGLRGCAGNSDTRTACQSLARFSDAEYRLPPELQGGRGAAERAGEPLHQHAPPPRRPKRARSRRMRRTTRCCTAAGKPHGQWKAIAKAGQPGNPSAVTAVSVAPRAAGLYAAARFALALAVGHHLNAP